MDQLLSHFRAPLLQIRSTSIERVNHFKLLGVWFQDNLKRNAHVENITNKSSKRIYYLRKCRRARLPRDVGLSIYTTLIRPILEYGAPLCEGIPSYLKDEVKRIQKRCLTLIGLPPDSLPSLELRRNEASTKQLNKISNDNSLLLHNRASVTRNCDCNLTTNCRKLVPISGRNRHKNSFLPRALKHN